MATLRDLQYMIEANTQGLNKAYPALDRLVASLERLDKSVNRSAKSVDDQMKRVGASTASSAASVSKSADQIKAAMKRQEAAMVSAKAKVLDLNRAINQSGGSSRLIANNTRAFNVLEKQLKRTDATTAELTLAKAKFNSALATSRRELVSFNAAQRQTETAQKNSQTALLRQSNTLERTRQRFLDFGAALRSAGDTNKLNELTVAFQQLEQRMQSGQLTAEQFSDAVNSFNGEMARIKRSTKFAEGLKGGFQEITKSAQIALGPLSGVASRMQNLTSLANSTSLAIAGTVGVVIALSAALVKSIIDGARWEKQFSRMNKILSVTGNSALISAQRAELVVRKVSQSTSALQNEVREAAAGLLTIQGMNEELLESSLKAAQGLAIIGGGSIQTSFRNLAQVLQDPAQGLQTLTQYGVKFTAAEREQILALEEAGDRTGALDLIMKKLAPHIAAATSETKTLSGAWHEMTDSLLSFSQDFANDTGILAGLNALISGMNNAARMGSLAFNETGKVMRGVNKLYDAIEDSDDPEGALKALRESMKEIVRRTKEVEGTNLIPDVDVADLKKAFALVNAGDIQGATAALDKYIKKTESAAKSAKLHEIAVNQAMDMYSTLKGEFLGIITDMEHLDNKLTGLDKNWKFMVEGLMAAGKTAEQAHAILRRLRVETELQTSAFKNYVNGLEQSTIQAQQEANITSAMGSEKRKLQIEQRILNDLWASGIVTSSNYQAALEDLRKMGLGSLIEELEKAAKAAEAADFTNMVAQMNKQLDDQIAIAKVARDVAVSSAREQSEALAVAAKMQEMLNAGIAQGTEEWNKQLSKVRELVGLEFQKEMAKSQKDLEDQLKLATVAADAAALSALEQAMAIAQAAKMQEMLNQGIEVGSEYWNHQLQLVRELANTDFTAGHNQALKSMREQASAQEAIMDSMFYSERTRKQMVDLAAKEYELAERYGSLLDERAQKELAVFKQLQARDSLVKDWQEVADAVDKAFKGLEDSIVDFLKTGEFNFHKFANSILEDIFRITFRQLITRPMQDMLGGLMSNITGKGGIGGLAANTGEFLGGTGTLANPAYVYVMNSGFESAFGMAGGGAFNPTQGGFAEMLGLGGQGGGGAGLLPGQRGIGSDAVASGMGGLSTFGVGPVGSVTRSPLGPIVEASEKAGRVVTQSFDAVDYASQRVAQAHEGLSSSFVDSYKGLNLSMANAETAVGQFGKGATTATEALSKNFGPGGDVSKMLELSSQDVQDIMKVTQTEVVQSLKGANFDKQVGGVVDTILNRKLSSQFPDSIRGVINQKSQFSKIAGPEGYRDQMGRWHDLNPYGKVQNMPFSAVNQKTQDAVLKHLNLRQAGMPSSVDGNLNYLNPKFSGAGAMRAWGNNVVADARQTGQIFGAGNAQHFHGTAPGFNPVNPNYGVGLPQQYQMPGMQSAFAPVQGTQLHGMLQQPGMGGIGMPGMNGFQMAGGGSYMGGSSFMNGFGGTSGVAGMAGMGGGMDGGLSQLAQSASQASESFNQLSTNIPQVTESLTSGLEQAGTAATELASGGLQQAQTGMSSLADNALTNAMQSQIQATASTTQMATQSSVAAMSVQQLGTAAMTSAAQMGGGGILGGIFHGGGIVGSGGGAAIMSGKGFATAPRLHGGLHPNEFRAILKRGEGVFTEDQMEMLGNAINRNGEAEDDATEGRRRRGGGGVTVHLHGVKDFDSFRKSQAQLNAGVSSAARQAEQRQN